MAVRYRETMLWDTVTHTDPVAAGDEFRYFSSVGTKTQFQQNFQNERRLQPGEEMRVWSIRCAYPDQGVTPADATLIQLGAVVNFLVDDVVQAQYPMWMLPQGGGMSHYTPEDAATTDQISNGIPTARAVFRRRRPIIITDENTYEVVIRYGTAANMSASVVVQVVLEVQRREIVRA